jgi:hypothetical protein
MGARKQRRGPARIKCHRSGGAMMFATIAGLGAKNRRQDDKRTRCIRIVIGGI